MKLKIYFVARFFECFSFIIFHLFCLLGSFSVKSQNYVGSNNEMTIRSEIDFSTSASWETNKSIIPGFFTWVAGSENYTGATDEFHINGYAKKVGNTAFTFPVGSGSDLRTLSISASTSVSDEYAVAWMSGDPGNTPDPTNVNALHSTTAFSGLLSAVSLVGQWDWVPVVGDGAGLTVTVSIPAVSGLFFTNASNIRLVGWNGVSWVVLGSTGATGLTEGSLLSGVMIAGIQAIGIGSVESVLIPIVAPNFTVIQEANGLLSVSGIAEKGSAVLITFPDGSTTTVVASVTGAFGPVVSDKPQVNKGFVTAIATNSAGLSSNLITVSYDNPITVQVSEAFTPDGDGINDTWVIYELDKYPNSTVRVYNRWGHLVFSAKDYQNDWDGHFKNNGTALPQSGSYYYQIDYGTDGTINKEGWLYIRK